MRLLDVHTYPPPQPEDKLTKRRYAILSHTWAETEIVFSDLSTKDSVFQARLRRDLDSWRKIRGAQKRAKEDGFDFIWIDTLCIDKSSSTELSEAINSMYRWYQEAEVCYVYLTDVDAVTASGSELLQTLAFNCAEEQQKHQFKSSRWFKRGWTLQELVAPKSIQFFDREWNLIGDMQDLTSLICEATRVHSDIFSGAPLMRYSVAQRMSWAANRETTRPEDRAYSLLGILDVSLDIRYGEGTKAFIRLQEEIIRQSDDESLFAWGKPMTLEDERDMRAFPSIGEDLLAPSPDAFEHASNIVPFSRHQSSSSYTITNRGLRILAPVVNGNQICLNCRYIDDPTITILLNAYTTSGDYRLIGDAKPTQGSEIDVTLQAPSRNSKKRTWPRLSLRDAAEVVPSQECLQLTISRGRNVPVTLDQMKAYPAQSLTDRLWLFLEPGYKLKRYQELSHVASDQQPSILLPFVFKDSEPKPDPVTRTLTYSISLARNDSLSVFVIRLHHPSGHEIDIIVAIRSHEDHAFSPLPRVVLQMSPAKQDDKQTLTELRQSMRLTDVEPRGLSMQFKGDETSRTHVLDRKLTAIATLRRENLSGEWPFVLRVSMVPTTPYTAFRYSLFGTEQRPRFLSRDLERILPAPSFILVDRRPRFVSQELRLLFWAIFIVMSTTWCQLLVSTEQSARYWQLVILIPMLFVFALSNTPGHFIFGFETAGDAVRRTTIALCNSLILATISWARPDRRRDSRASD